MKTARMHTSILGVFIIFIEAQLTFGGEGELNDLPLARAERVFNSRVLKNVLREAEEFQGNLLAAKDASSAVGTKLDELRSVLAQQQGDKNPSTVSLPSGWDKSSLIDALSKAANQNKQLQELSDKFDRFMETINQLEGAPGDKNQTTKTNETRQFKNKAKGFPLPSSPLRTLESLDNSTLMGKLVGFVKTGRRLGSFSLSRFDPCTNSSCDKWRKGLENLRNFFSKSATTFVDLFKNSAALRKLIQESSVTSEKEASKNATGLVNATRPESETDRTPIDYFDDYYNHEGNAARKPSTAAPNRTEGKISSLKHNVNGSARNNVLNEARQITDYFDYYYNQGIPAIIGDKSKFTRKEPAD